MTLRFGIHVTNQYPRGSDMLRALDGQLLFLRYARDNGWDSAWACQHFLSESLSQLQPMPYLARLAAESGHLRNSLAAQLLPLVNPLFVVEEFASLDVKMQTPGMPVDEALGSMRLFRTEVMPAAKALP